jgi:hypothetical protein
MQSLKVNLQCVNSLEAGPLQRTHTLKIDFQCISSLEIDDYSVPTH